MVELWRLRYFRAVVFRLVVGTLGGVIYLIVISTERASKREFFVGVLFILWLLTNLHIAIVAQKYVSQAVREQESESSFNFGSEGRAHFELREDEKQEFSSLRNTITEPLL